MDKEKWRKLFREHSLKLASRLTFEETMYIANSLRNQCLLTTAELEYCLGPRTSYETVSHLIDLVLKNDHMDIYCSLLDILEGQLHRHDLVELFGLCRVGTGTNVDKEQKLCTRESTGKARFQSCIFHDSHSLTMYEYHYRLISLEFENQKKWEIYTKMISPEILSVSEYSDIRTLTISRYQLARVGIQLQNCENITTLRIIQCKLTELPQEIIHLTQLEELDLHGNQLRNCSMTTFSDHLPQLKVLDVRQCELNEIPDWFGNLSKLEKLLISGNSFEGGLGRSVARLKNLRHLDVEACNLPELPDWLTELSMLETIALPKNRDIKKINSLKKLTHLQKLDASLCDLRALPMGLEDLSQLQEALFCGNKHLQQLDLSIRKWNKLRKLVVSSCNLNELPLEMSNLSQLEELSLWGNGSLKELPDSLKNLLSLSHLDAAGCGLSTLPNWLQKLEMLEELDFSENAIQSFPAEFFEIKRLKRLRLGQCEITEVPHAFSKLTVLEHLDLSNNKLKTFPSVTLSLVNLRCLNVENFSLMGGRGNDIKVLPYKLVNSSLDELHVNNNPLERPPLEICSQGLQKIRLYLSVLKSDPGKIYNDTINLLGDSRAGKTSIARSLMNGSPTATHNDDRTCLFDQLQADICKKIITINDFGGHDIYQYVIPVFLPPGGLCVIVYRLCDPEETCKETVEKWMSTVLQKSTEKVRVIVVGTHADMVGDDVRISRTNKIKGCVQLFKDKALKQIQEYIAKKRGLADASRSDLELKMKKIQEADIAVVTIGCNGEDQQDRLNSFMTAVSEKLTAALPMPNTWTTFIQDEFSLKKNATSTCFYVTYERLLENCGQIVGEDKRADVLTIILNYLKATSQIIWLESLRARCDIVYHNIPYIIELFKSVLCYDLQTGRLEEQVDNKNLSKQYKDDYRMGKICSTVVGYLLNDSKPEPIIQLMEYFNLLVFVQRTDHEEHFIMPSNLPEVEPTSPKPQDKNTKGFLFYVALRLDFTGALLPAAFLPSLMVHVISWACAMNPVVWKDNVKIYMDKGCIWMQRKENSLMVNVSHKESVAELRKMAERARDIIKPKIDNEWCPALVHWWVVCPSCLCSNNEPYHTWPFDWPTRDSQEYKVKSLYCCKCEEDVPQSVMWPYLHGQITDQDEKDSKEFFYRLRISGQGATQATATQSGNSKWKAMEQRQLQQAFQRNYDTLISSLTSAETNAIASSLYSLNWLIISEVEMVCLKGRTATDVAQTLVDIITKKNVKELYFAVLETLQNDLQRHDLVRALTPFDS